MRIYAVADIHGKPDKIAMVREKTEDLKPDVLVVAGDITNYFNSADVIEQFNHMPAPVLAIRGNTDLKKVNHLLDYYPNTSSLHLKEQTINGLKFVGVSGTIPVPFSSRIGLHEKRIINALAALVDDNSVLVVHSPPRGVLDDAFGKFHAGCRRLYHLVVQRQPRLVLCGHIHERPGIASIGQTTVVNCSVARTGRGAVVDFESDGSFRVQML
ncbi:MAG: metallophosphoesterase family protein [Proteobacteria bacterium]|nr:metallophosphoesterase family protein [Pseudomonadota bacterium]